MFNTENRFSVWSELILKNRGKACELINNLLKCIIKTHVRGFFDTDLHEVSWHFATHEAVRPSGF